MAEKSKGPDIRQLREEKLAEGKFPGDASQDFRVFIDPKVHAEIHKHAKDDTSVEVCGVLVGKLQRDENGPFVSITASIRGDAAASKEAEVTFTHATWAKINAQMDKEYRDLAIVGWYHTHPNFGIFLSDRDTFIHEHFFSGPGQIAYVVDPVRKAEGVFIWHDGKPALQPYYSIGSRLYISDTEGAPRESDPGRRAMGDAKKAAASAAATSRHDDAGGPSGGGGGWNGFFMWSTQILFLLCGLAIGWLFFGARDLALMKQQTDQLTAAVIKDSRVGLREGAEAAQLELVGAFQAAQEVRKATKPVSDKDTEALNNEWHLFEQRMNGAMRLLEYVKEVYGLSPEEIAAIRRAAEKPQPATRPASTQPSSGTPSGGKRNAN